MDQLFVNCGLNGLREAEGQSFEYSVTEASDRRAKSLNRMTGNKHEKDIARYLFSREAGAVIFDALFGKVEKAERFARYRFHRFDLFKFRRVRDLQNGKEYDFYRLTTFDGPCVSPYIFFVLAVDHPGAAACARDPEVTEKYRLVRISTPQVDFLPESSWCQREKSWFWSTETDEALVP